MESIESDITNNDYGGLSTRQARRQLAKDKYETSKEAAEIRVLAQAAVLKKLVRESVLFKLISDWFEFRPKKSQPERGHKDCSRTEHRGSCLSKQSWKKCLKCAVLPPIQLTAEVLRLFCRASRLKN